jgi:uncharacterized protein (TIGR02145 family)
MKKIFFLFVLLANITASAQNMQITTISATYTASPVVQFKVGWTGARTYRHNTKVWVFVDYRKIENNAPAGSWTRAAVTATPAVLSTPATTTATLVPGNDKGFWLHGVDGDYSATLTVTLSGVPAQFNWCAYATDYPPNVVIHGNSSYTLRGSRPFIINGTALPITQTTYSGTITSFTDATGAPGLFLAAQDEKPNEMGCLAGLVENINGICITPAAAGCNAGTLVLGATSFTAGNEVEIIGNGISQIWSRPVTAEGCQKQSFDPDTSKHVADCRANPDYNGDLFNGCAVIYYGGQLCPPPWRVPSARDFEQLLTALGSESTFSVINQSFMDEKIIGVWKGEYNGGLHPLLTTNGWAGRNGSYTALRYGGDMESYYGRFWTIYRLVFNNQKSYVAEVMGEYGVQPAAMHYSYAVRCVQN